MSQSPTNLATRTYVSFAVLMLVWCLAWLGKVAMDARSDWFASPAPTAVFWFVAKCLIWILPACYLIHISGRRWSVVFNLPGWRQWGLWGTVVGLLIATTGFLPKFIAGQPLLPGTFDSALLNVVVIAPLFEEFLIRAAILPNLIPQHGFARANVIASLFFVVLHLPGWYFMGTLWTNLTLPVGGALSIFVLGLLFGWVAHKGRSFLGGSIAHCLNNVAA